MREMKNSGVEWIGEIPSTWRVMPLKALFSFGKGLPITKENLEEAGVPVISYGQIHAKWNSGVTTHDNLLRYVNRSYLESNPQSLVQMGDFIMADTSEDREGCGNCAYIDVKDVLFAGYHTIILRSNYNADNKYLAYLFLTDSWRSQIRKSVSGVKLFSISRRILGSVSVLLPDNTKPIVHYLDSKCSQIDTLIQNVQTQIEKLKAYKQSLITELVTKGLDPTVPMKDSGVSWIGEVASTHTMFRLKYLLASPMQYGANESGDKFTEGAVRYIRITDITAEGKLKDDDANQYLTMSVARDYILKDKDILFARSGGTVGKSFLFYEKYGISAFAGYLIKAECNRAKLLPEYLMYHTQSSLYELWKNMIFIQATIQNIGANKYANMEIPVPSIEAQTSIVSYLDAKCSKIDHLIAIKQAKIEKLEQYKRSLIYEYVTGKKEVV